MSDDLEMVRGEIPGGFNLGLGEPVVVQEELGSLGAYNTKWLDSGPWQYPDLFGHPELLQRIREAQPWAKHIVIGNGAKQCLSAAMYALKTEYDYDTVLHKAPYWPSYPTLANMAGLSFIKKHNMKLRNIRCVSAPNNPDGSIDNSIYRSSCEILDCAYDSPLYKSALRLDQADARMVVYSAAKLFGAPGLRVGWMLTDDYLLARAARHYIELTTSGVGLVSQQLTARLLDFSRFPGFESCVTKVQAKTDLNAVNLMDLIGYHLERVEGSPRGSGMFAWVKPNDYEHFTSALESAKVAVVSGKACGVPGWYRINMAHNTEYTAKALQALAKELNK